MFLFISLYLLIYFIYRHEINNLTNVLNNIHFKEFTFFIYPKQLFLFRQFVLHIGHYLFFKTFVLIADMMVATHNLNNNKLINCNMISTFMN